VRNAEHRQRSADDQRATNQRPTRQQALVPAAQVHQVTTVAVSEHRGRPETSASPARPQTGEQARHTDHAAPPEQPASAQPAAAPQRQQAHNAGCAPQRSAAGEDGDQPAPGHRKVTPIHQRAPNVGTHGIALVATPSKAVAPIFTLTPPVTSLHVSSDGLPAAPTLPLQAAPPPALSPTGSPAANPPTVPTPMPKLSASPLATRLQSAVTVGALWLLVPLLLVVLVFQLRLMHQLRSLAAGPAVATPRHYSVTQDEVRALAPDMLPALAHHQFCESRRHQGRWRPAKWLELEETDSDVPLMWATCDTCHHERMTRLRSGRDLAVSR
jgi:hypothetical protein